MPYSVSRETLDITSCSNDFACLSGDMENVCEVLDTDWARVVVTDCPNRSATCDYCRPFKGVKGICTCPTRTEVYARYGV